MPKTQSGNNSDIQRYLKEWDKYQNKWIAGSDFDSERPLLLPISVDIASGVIARSRLKSKYVIDLLTRPGNTLPSDIGTGCNKFTLNDIHKHYASRGFPQDANEGGGVPFLPTPLDFNIRTKVLFLFHLPRKNWTFSKHKQFTIDGFENTNSDHIVEVLGTFNNGRGLAVFNKFWIPEGQESYNIKYNLHVTIAQKIDGNDMSTDIIIDPGSNSDGSTDGGGLGGG